MSFVVHKTPAALRDIAEQGAYIGLRSPRTEIRFYEAAERTFEALAEMPGMGRRWLSYYPGLEGVRVSHIRGFRNWLVFYRPINGGIEVLHVFHGARDIPRLLEQEGE